jgi:hypothetical protein
MTQNKSKWIIRIYPGNFTENPLEIIGKPSLDRHQNQPSNCRVSGQRITRILRSFRVRSTSSTNRQPIGRIGRNSSPRRRSMEDWPPLGYGFAGSLPLRLPFSSGLTPSPVPLSISPDLSISLDFSVLSLISLSRFHSLFLSA